MINNSEKKKKSTKISEFKEMCFRFYILVLQNENLTLIHRVAFLVFEFCQIISFGFMGMFQDYWRHKELMIKLYNFFSFFCIFNIFQGSYYFYIFGFYLSVVIVVVYTIGSQICSFVLRNVISAKNHVLLEKFYVKTYHCYLNVLFLPLFDSLLSILNCPNNKNYYCSDLACDTYSYYIHLGIGSFLSIVLVLYSVLSTMLCYDPFSEAHINTQQTAVPEIFFMFFKIVIIVCVEVIGNAKFYSVVYVCFSCLLFSFYYRYSSYYYPIRYKLNISFSFILVCHSLSLFFSIIFNKWNFNCGYIIFFISSVFTVGLFFLLLKEGVSLRNHNKARDSIEGCAQLSEVFALIKGASENKRKYHLLLKAYAYYFEQDCIVPNCPLKQFQRNFSNIKFSQSIKVLFIQHINIRFKGVIKNSDSNFAKLMYAKFLYSVFEKPNLAKLYIYEVSTRNLSLFEEFLLYRLTSMTNESLNYLSFKSEDVNYLRLVTELRDNIVVISSLYMNFWNSLILSRQNTNGNTLVLDDSGKKIEFLKKQIFSTYAEIMKVKPNDIKVMSFFADFLREVMDEEKEAYEIRKKIEETKGQEETDYLEGGKFLDLHNIPQTDKVHYIIVSGNRSTFGNVIELSLTFCNYSGYLKEDLIGKNYKKLLPDFFWAAHDKMLLEKLNEIEMSDGNKKIDKKAYKTFQSFFVSKSRYLKLATYSPTLMINELEMKYFVVKINFENFERKGKFVEPCCVLTDMKLVIQNYTINCNKLLAMNNIEDIIKEKFYINNYIYQNSTDHNIITWVKKSGKYNVNSDFYWSNQLIKIKEENIGFFLTLFPKEETTISKEIYIDSQFVPPLKNEAYFVYNSKNNSFLHEKQVGEKERNAFLEELKTKAVQKTELLTKKPKSDSSDTNGTESSNVSEESEDSDDDGSSLNSNSTSGNKLELNESEEEKKSEKIRPQVNLVQSSSLSEFYHVKVDKIKYFIYNYNEHRCVPETDPIYFISQTEKKISVRQAEELPKYKDPRQRIVLQISTENRTATNSINEDQEIREKILKQIQYSISKTEVSTSIIKLTIVGFFTFLVLFCEGIITFTLFRNVDNKLSEASTHVEDSYAMLMNCLYASFYSRELTLLSFPDYTVGFQDLDDYFQDVLALLKEKSRTLQQLTDTLITTNLKFSDETNYVLNNETIKMFMITDDNTVLNFNVTINAGIGQTTSDLFYLTSYKRKDIIPTHNVAYFGIVNSLNGMMNGVQAQIDVVSEEYVKINKQNLFLFLIILIVYFCFGTFFYFFLSKSHFTVESSKEAYLAIFEEISTITIAIWMEKCTNFHQKYTIAGINGNGLIEESASCGDDDQEVDEFMVAQPNKLSGKKTKTMMAKKKKSHQGYLMKKIVIFCTMLFSSFLSVVIYFISKDVFNTLDIEMDVYTKSTTVYLQYVQLFNSFREYMFDQTSVVNYINVKTHVENTLNDIYNKTRTIRLLFEKSKDKLRQEFIEVYYNTYFGDLCSVYSLDYFQELTNHNKNKSCNKILNDGSSFVRYLYNFL